MIFLAAITGNECDSSASGGRKVSRPLRVAAGAADSPPNTPPQPPDPSLPHERHLVYSAVTGQLSVSG